jgi:ribosomal protein S6
MAKVKKITEDESKEDSRLCVYEVGYHMVPTIAEENLAGEVTAFKDFLSSNNVSFISEEFPKMMELAYEMTRSVNNKKQKFSYGYFGWIKFECTPESAQVIKEALDKNEKIIRYLLIKTVRENTISQKRAYRGGEKRRVSSAKTQDSAVSSSEEVIDEEVIDKEIDALVA